MDGQPSGPLVRPPDVKERIAVAALLLTGCTATTTPGSTMSTAPSLADPPATTATAAPAGTSHPASPKQVSADPDARLTQVRVTRRGGVVRFAALWDDGTGRKARVLVEGRGERRLRTPSPRAAERDTAFPAPSRVPTAQATEALGRLLPLEVTSLDPGTRVLIGGGDGATLLPFQRVARSERHGAWSARPLPLFDGERAYTSGAVALPDGRLVALLDHFSDDRAGRPADRHHGLWASAGGDWTAYTPFEPRFTPALEAPEDGWGPLVSLAATTAPDPIVWVTTFDHRVYVSSDLMRTFRELPVR